MTYPPGYPPQPQQPQNGYPPAPPQPQYQPPAPPQPQYQQPAPQGYAPPQQPQYPPAQQGYAPPPMGYPTNQYPPAQGGYPMQPPPVQLAAGSLDAFYSQPSVGGGAALKFEAPRPSPAPGYPDIPGTTYVGVVSREVTSADVQQQTNPQNGQAATFKDGRPKFVMKVPLQVQPTADRPDGLAQWYVAGAARDELARAMAAVGAPEGPPEAGAVVQITCTGTRPSGAGMNPSKVYQVNYQRPNEPAGMMTAAVNGVPTAIDQPQQQPPAQPQYQAPPVPQQQQYQAPQPPAHQQFQPPAPPQPQPPAPPQPQQFQAPQQGAQPPAPQFDPASLPPMSAEQQNLLAGLIGQQQPQPTG